MSELELVNSIPIDSEVEMTADLQRAFRMLGCDPCCHCCLKLIPVGMIFKLAFIESEKLWYYEIKTQEKDEMLCSSCTPRMLRMSRKKDAKYYRDNKTTGYTRIRAVTQ